MKLSELIATFSLQSRGRGWVGLAVLCLLLLSGVVVLAQVPALMRSMNAPTKVDVQPISGDDLKARTDLFRKTLTATADKVTTRSPFYPPKPKAPPPPPTPTRYSGPAIIGMVSDSVFFADGKRLSVGSPSDGGLAVVSVDPPWSAKLRYNGAEFTVNLFERDPVKLNTGLGGSTTPPGMSTEPASRSGRGNGGGRPEFRDSRADGGRGPGGPGGGGGPGGPPRGGEAPGAANPQSAPPDATQPAGQPAQSVPTTVPASEPAPSNPPALPDPPLVDPASSPAPAPPTTDPSVDQKPK